MGQTEWLAELRRVSVVFLRLDQLNADMLDCGPALCLAAEHIQRVAHNFDGSVVHFLADDKGTVAILGFGIAPNSPERQALRAVSAAQAIIEHFLTQKTTCSAGITTGEVFCGPLGSAGRRCYTVLGDVVNLAARLMQSSHGEVLCDQGTYAETASEIRYTRGPNHRIKSYDEPVPVYRSHLPRDAARHSLGRDHELKLLERMISHSQQGGPQTLIIEGEPGVGKSELVGELMRRAASRGLIAIVGAASNVDRFTPYFVFRPILGNLMGLRGDDDVAGRREQEVFRHLRAAAGGSRRLAPLLNSILATQFPENDFVRQLTGDHRNDNLQRLLLAILQRSTDAGNLHFVIFDDVQWLDAASWTLVRNMVERLNRVTVVLVTRPQLGDVVESFAAIRAAHASQQMALSTLPRDAIVALIARLVGQFQIDDVLVEHIWTRCGGNPFFAKELISFLVDADRLVVEEGVCGLNAAGSGTKDAIPNSIRDVLAARIGQLSQPVQLTAKSASVIGRHFCFKELDAIFPVEVQPTELLNYTRDLCRHDIVAPIHEETIAIGNAPTPNEPRELMDPAARQDFAFVFSHLTTQQVAYQQLPRAQRRQLHKAIAAWYEQQASHDERRHSIIAQHLELAEAFPQAAVAFAEAGTGALRQGASKEAIEHLKKALEYGQTHNEVTWNAHFRRLLGEAYMQAGDLESSRAELNTALNLFGHESPLGMARSFIAIAYMLAQQEWRRLRPRRSSGVKLSDEPKIGDVAHSVALTYQRLGQSATTVTTSSPASFRHCGRCRLPKETMIHPAWQDLMPIFAS